MKIIESGKITAKSLRKLLGDDVTDFDYVEEHMSDIADIFVELLEKTHKVEISELQTKFQKLRKIINAEMSVLDNVLNDDSQTTNMIQDRASNIDIDDMSIFNLLLCYHNS